MSERFIQLLDCTLRDGSYITGSHFGAGAIRGIISKIRKPTRTSSSAGGTRIPSMFSARHTTMCRRILSNT